MLLVLFYSVVVATDIASNVVVIVNDIGIVVIGSDIIIGDGSSTGIATDIAIGTDIGIDICIIFDILLEIV